MIDEEVRMPPEVYASDKSPLVVDVHTDSAVNSIFRYRVSDGAIPVLFRRKS